MNSTESISNAVFALLQKSIGNNSGLKKGQLGPCFKCGKLGHLARNCPDTAVNKDTDRTTSGKINNWKRVAPLAGEAETKKVGKRTFYWCAKCNRWSTTHSTATHVKKSDSSPESANLMLQPVAMCLRNLRLIKGSFRFLLILP